MEKKRIAKKGSNIKDFLRALSGMYDVLLQVKETLVNKDSPEISLALKNLDKILKYGEISHGKKCFFARKCQNCGNNTLVYDSRVVATGEVIRHRKCPFCGWTQKTVEIIDWE